MNIVGKCHCGNISFSLEWPGDATEIPARACTCSFCVKHGGIWTSNPAASLAVAVRDASQVSRYCFETGTATFHVCSRCGAVPYVTSDIDGRTFAVVNVNAFENLAADRVRHSPVSFEGENLDSRIGRRRQRWIPDVRTLGNDM